MAAKISLRIHATPQSPARLPRIFGPSSQSTYRAADCDSQQHQMWAAIATRAGVDDLPETSVWLRRMPDGVTDTALSSLCQLCLMRRAPKCGRRPEHVAIWPV